MIATPDASDAMPSSSPASMRTSCLGRIVQILVFLWIIFVSFSNQLSSWLAAAMGSESNPVESTFWQVAELGIPLLILAWAWRGQREQAMYRTWFAATMVLLLLAPTRWIAPAQAQWTSIAQLVILLICVVLLRFAKLKQARSESINRNQLLLAIAGAMLFAYPWLMSGALGSVMDILLAIALGLAAGVVVAQLLDFTWFPSLRAETHGRGADLFSGGLVTGAATLIIASGLSQNGVQVLLMVALPALGWLAVALSYAKPSDRADTYDWRPPALLIGLGAVAVLAFTDVDTFAIESMDAAITAGFTAAMISVVIGWVLGATALVGRRQWGGAGRPAVAAALVALLAAGGIVLYFTSGEPGLHGNRILVILKDQADVSQAAQITDYDERRSTVYQRLVDHADATQAGIRSLLDTLHVAYTPYYLVNAIEVDGGILAQLLLQFRPEVDRVLPSPRMRPSAGELSLPEDKTESPPEELWNLSDIGADRVWEDFGVTGEGIVVGESDSGVQLDHPELQAQYRGLQADGTFAHDYNWLDPWSNSTSPVDFGGHGTHTLGTVLGANVGVAPGAQWIGCTNLQRNLGNPAFYLDCLQFMLAPYPQQGDPFRDGDPLRSANVLNNSWGCPEKNEGCDPQSLQPAVEALRAAGIFVVASAGNEGPLCSSLDSPIAIYDAAFTVGASDINRNLAPFSSVGPVTVDGSGRIKPDILAPGVQVPSAYPTNAYTALDGTSMAGPHVAGVVALLWSADPALIGDIDRTETLLIETATPFTGTLGGLGPVELEDGQATPDPVAELLLGSLFSRDACVYKTDLAQEPNVVAGYGIVNAYAAVKQAVDR